MLTAASVVGKTVAVGDNGYRAGERHRASLSEEKITEHPAVLTLGIVTYLFGNRTGKMTRQGAEQCQRLFVSFLSFQ
jgi:hypothetical protein